MLSKKKLRLFQNNKLISYNKQGKEKDINSYFTPEELDAMEMFINDEKRLSKTLLEKYKTYRKYIDWAVLCEIIKDLHTIPCSEKTYNYYFDIYSLIIHMDYKLENKCLPEVVFTDVAAGYQEQQTEQELALARDKRIMELFQLMPEKYKEEVEQINHWNKLSKVIEDRCPLDKFPSINDVASKFPKEAKEDLEEALIRLGRLV